MEYKLSSWGPRRSLRSPSFYIFTYGYMMYLRMYPRQNGQNVYIHVGLTKVLFRIRGSISYDHIVYCTQVILLFLFLPWILKGEYDEALEWPFTLRHRISVLDQSALPQDIISRVWDPKVLILNITCCTIHPFFTGYRLHSVY